MTGDRIRIAHCIHGVGLGGAQQVIRFIAGGSDRTRFEHFVYASQSGVFHRQIEDAGATVRIVPRHVPKLDPLWVWHMPRHDADRGMCPSSTRCGFGACAPPCDRTGSMSSTPTFLVTACTAIWQPGGTGARW